MANPNKSLKNDDPIKLNKESQLYLDLRKLSATKRLEVASNPLTMPFFENFKRSHATDADVLAMNLLHFEEEQVNQLSEVPAHDSDALPTCSSHATRSRIGRGPKRSSRRGSQASTTDSKERQKRGIRRVDPASCSNLQEFKSEHSHESRGGQRSTRTRSSMIRKGNNNRLRRVETAPACPNSGRMGIILEESHTPSLESKDGIDAYLHARLQNRVWSDQKNQSWSLPAPAKRWEDGVKHRTLSPVPPVRQSSLNRNEMAEQCRPEDNI
jgi:hypothetical protein